jgi:N-acetylmuramoyl-L-alanine amidase
MKKFFSVFLSIVVIIISLIFCEIQYSSSSNIHLNNFPVIIVDAGHGGEDGGAVANDGTIEKDLNLQISLKLNNVLSILGYKTKLIRVSDTDLHTLGDTIRERKVSDIRNRFTIMNKSDNCLYISIHQNKFEIPKYKGLQVYYSPNNELSRKIAGSVQHSVCQILQPNNNRKIKKTDNSIFLLQKITSAAILIECGFISNPSEAELLDNDEYRNKLASVISVAITNTFERQVYEN